MQTSIKSVCVLGLGYIGLPTASVIASRGVPVTGVDVKQAVVDKVSPEFHELAGRAKDMGSAAVFLLMLNVLVCWTLILWQRL